MSSRELSDTMDAVQVLDEAVELTSDVTDLKVETPLKSDIYQNQWDRLEKETDHQWDLFKHYRDSGAGRD